jgi:hypothetical protein
MKLEGAKEEWATGLAGLMLGGAITCSIAGYRGYAELLGVLTATFVMVWRRIYPRRNTAEWGQSACKPSLRPPALEESTSESSSR